MLPFRVSLRAAARIAVGCLLAASVPARAGWDNTATTALVPPAGTVLGALPADTPMQVTVTLKLRNKGMLDQLVRNQHTPGNPMYGRTLTPAQVHAQFDPTSAQAKMVADYLKSAGFTTVRVSKGHTLVGGTATAAVVQRAFNTQLAQATIDGVSGYLNLQPAQVPGPLAGVVLSVNGLQNVVRMKTDLQQSAARAGVTVPYRAGVLPRIEPNSASGGVPDPSNSAFGPNEFQKAYDALGVTPGSNTVIAISTYGDDLKQVIADLRQAEQNNHLPYVPVELRVESPIPDADMDTGGDGEWALDTQSSTGIAGNVKKLVLYTADENVPASLLWQYANFASDDSSDAPTIGNMSYGTCDVLWPVTTAAIFTYMPDMASADQEFEKAAAEGRSWHASSGDSGGACSPGNFQALPDTGP
ncbi:MAG TPA: protease pro-enzyme activation domain-containing protein, partial [Nevskiaceae bacterium]|nr:protease pro-enzyme activation domain-containing protein [Nevskiaceae bacterium]